MLEPELLLDAYCHGIFPMAVNQRGTIGWFSPDPRAIIPLDARFHVPHGLRRALKKNLFEIAFDKDFAAVIRECAERRDGTWISPGIVKAYTALHRLGHAHSVEVYAPRSPLHVLSAACTAYTLARCFSARACFITRRTPRKLPWSRWSSDSGSAGSCCWTRSGRRHTSGSSAP